MKNLSIIKNQDSFEAVLQDDNDFNNALNKICEHVENKDFYYRNAYAITKNLDISGDFKNKNLRRSYYLQSNFNDCDFTGVGLTDSIFKQTHFNSKALIDNANFESSYFFDCDFHSEKPYNYVGFSKSNFYNSVFYGIDFYHCKMSDILFQNSLFENCNFDNTTFDSSIFCNANFDNVTFKNLNLEYTQFNNTHFNNTALPFPTIPFIINGIAYLKTTSDKVFIKSAKYGKITKSQYLEMLPYLKTFYVKTENYFPLANIFIADKDIENSYNAIKNGVIQSIFLNNYRQLKNYCILADTCNLFDIHEKKSLIDIINENFQMCLKNNYLFYLPITQNIYDLQNTLLKSNSASLTVSFRTNIVNNNYCALSEFYKIIDKLVSVVGLESNYSINFSFNSNAEIIAIISSLDTSIIVALITAFTTIFLTGIKGVAHLPEVIEKFLTIRQNLALKQAELLNMQLDAKKKELEIANQINSSKKLPDANKQFDSLIENIKPVLEDCDKLKKSGVQVLDLKYTSVDVNIEEINDLLNSKLN